jgi:excisionase family DNA binding protein
MHLNIEKLSQNREPFLTTAAVARWLGVSARTVCLWAECKEIPAIKIGRQWRFREGELGEWLASANAASRLKYNAHDRSSTAAVV